MLILFINFPISKLVSILKCSFLKDLSPDPWLCNCDFCYLGVV